MSFQQHDVEGDAEGLQLDESMPEGHAYTPGIVQDASSLAQRISALSLVPDATSSSPSSEFPTQDPAAQSSAYNYDAALQWQAQNGTRYQLGPNGINKLRVKNGEFWLLDPAKMSEVMAALGLGAIKDIPSLTMKDKACSHVVHRRCSLTVRSVSYCCIGKAS